MKDLKNYKQEESYKLHTELNLFFDSYYNENLDSELIVIHKKDGSKSLVNPNFSFVTNDQNNEENIITILEEANNILLKNLNESFKNTFNLIA